MNFTAEELRKLTAPAIAFVALIALGAALIWYVQELRVQETQRLAAARADRAQAGERLSRIAEEEREVKEKIEVYRRLKDLDIIGEERRLRWIDAMARIRAQRELLDVRYQVERQRQIASVAGKAGAVEFNSSLMNVEIALLHEGDLLGFLSDLRQSGNAYYSVQHCGVTRTGQSVSATGLAPRLRASCRIELITILDRGAKT